VNQFKSLPSNSAYLTWQIPILETFSQTEENINKCNILETGIGKGTEFLLENFNKVFSFESSFSKEWYDMCTSIPINKWTHTFFDLNDPHIEYWKKIKDFCDFSKIDVALVDHGCRIEGQDNWGNTPETPECTRGETTLFLMKQGIKYIFVHDYPEGAYQYSLPATQYSEYGYTHTTGRDTGIFIKKQY